MIGHRLYFQVKYNNYHNYKKSSRKYMIRVIPYIKLLRNVSYFFSNQSTTTDNPTTSDSSTATNSQTSETDTSKTDQKIGTDYSKWVLARAAGHNHNIDIMRLKTPKDRYSIHLLTNISFMQTLIKFGYKYNLTMNQKILLLAQFNHMLQILNKNKKMYLFLLHRLAREVQAEMENPPDLICMGTLMCTMANLGFFQERDWVGFVDDLLVRKFDEEYDQFFGVVVALGRYRDFVYQVDDYEFITKNEVIPKIPIIFRNSLQTLRQFITHNIYNLKQCQILFQTLYNLNINQSYFWSSVRDWFNIYTKQQLNKKQMDEYFIMKESAVDRVLHDHGVIRPRPILQELSSIVFILSEFGYISWRFIQFGQDLVLYAIENGSRLFGKFREIQEKEQKEMDMENQGKIRINTHMKVRNQKQAESIKQMQKKYRTLFINPIAIKDNYVIYFLVILSRAYKKYKQPQKKQQKDKSTEFYDKTSQVYLDPRVKKWLLLQLTKPEMQYSPKQLITIHKCQQFLSDSQINIIQLICQKLTNIRITNTNFTQIQQLLQIIPPIHYNKLTNILIDFLHRNHPSQILKLTKLIQQKNLFPYMGQFMIRLPRAVNFHENYYSFQENCYFMLMMLKNSYSIQGFSEAEELRIKYQGQLEQLKESIKIVTYSRGFKISINSYFHKILDYINVVEFFQGGRS